MWSWRPASESASGSRRHTRSEATEDLIVITVVGVVVFVLAAAVDLFETLACGCTRGSWWTTSSP